MEKQQKKLEAKGIHVELTQLRTEWEAARNGGKGGNNLPIEDHEIDVVGDDSDNEDDDSSVNGGIIGGERSGSAHGGVDNCSSNGSAHSMMNRSPPPSPFITALSNNNFTGLVGGISPPPGITTTSPSVFPHPHPFSNILKLRNNFSIDNLLAVRCHQANLIKQEEGVNNEDFPRTAFNTSPPSPNTALQTMHFKQEET